MRHALRSTRRSNGLRAHAFRLWILLALAWLATGRAQGSKLTLTVLDPMQINAPGSVYSFYGEITNDTGTALQADDLFLNFEDYNPAVITPNQALGTPNFTIANDTTSADVLLFTIDFSAAANPQATYVMDVDVQDFTSDFVSPEVQVVIGPVPEPAPLLLLSTVPVLFVLHFLLHRAQGKHHRLGTQHLKPIASALALLLLCALPALHAQAPVMLDTGVTGQALLPSGTLELEIPLVNDGTGTASAVTITGITLAGAPPQSPTSFPVVVGDLGANKIANIYPSFEESGLTTSGQYPLTIRGTYTLDGALLGFTVNQLLTLLPANTLSGYSVAEQGTAAPTISPADYSPEPSEPEVDQANPPGPDIPTGPTHPGPVNGPTTVDESDAESSAATPAADPPAISILQNTSVQNDITARFDREVNDPSAASDGTLVLMTGNSYGLFSKNAGKTFIYIDPTTIFPNDDTNRLCCDQVVLYAPSVGRFFWLLQYVQVNGVNMLRLGSASSADLIAKGPTAPGVWSYYDITSAGLKLGTRWMDYNDLAIGNNHLYVSTNLISKDSIVASLIIRYPLADFPGQITYDWIVETGVANARAVQNCGDNGFWAANENTSAVRLWNQPENTLKVYQHKVAVPSWPHIFGDFDSFTPAPRTNWLKFLRDRRENGYGITGSTRSDNKLWFAWTAAKGAVENQDDPPKMITIPQPHVEAVAIIVGSYRLANRIILYNRNYAFAYPALATNGDGDIGISLTYGGTTTQPNHAVGFLSPEGAPLKNTTNSTRAFHRWGDYMSIRPEPDSNIFDAAGYGFTGSPDPHFVRFGPATPPP